MVRNPEWYSFSILLVPQGGSVVVDGQGNFVSIISHGRAIGMPVRGAQFGALSLHHWHLVHSWQYLHISCHADPVCSSVPSCPAE